MASRKNRRPPVSTNAKTSAPATRPKTGSTSQAITMPVQGREFYIGPYTYVPSTRESVLDGFLMSRYDTIVGSVLTVIKELICGKLGHYSNADENVEEFVQDNLDHLQDGFRDTVGSMLSCLWAGYSVSEVIWEADASAWRIKSINLLHPLTFFDRYDQTKIGIAYDPKVGGVSQFVQKAQRLGDPEVTFKPEQVVYWPLGRELREEVCGRRLTDRARRSWYMKSKIEVYWSVFLERFACPTPIFEIPRGTMLDEYGREITNSQYYANAIGDLAPGNGMAIEVGPEEHFAFNLLEPSSSNAGDGYVAGLTYHNAEIFRSMLMSPMLIDEPQNGSRAQANTALDLFMVLIDSIRTELGSVLIDQIVKPLLRYNYGDDTDLGEWEFDELVNDDLTVMSNVLVNIAKSTAITFTPEDEKKIRSIYGPSGLEDIDNIDLVARDAKVAEDAAAAAEALKTQQVQQPAQPVQPADQPANPVASEVS